jgi:hypothetical protein
VGLCADIAPASQGFLNAIRGFQYRKTENRACDEKDDPFQGWKPNEVALVTRKTVIVQRRSFVQGVLDLRDTILACHLLVLQARLSGDP